jgi:hypothetical protein
MPDDIRRREMRRHLLVLIALVAAVDALAIGTWFLAGLRGQSGVVQLCFAIVWAAATLGVVVVSMRKIKAAQRR